MKKNILIFVMGILLFSSFFMVSCQKETITDSGFSHSFVTTSFGASSNVIQVNGKMTFIDLSRGIDSRTWTFPESTVDTSFNKITSSDLPVVRVRFTTPGTAEVHISQVFNESVWANGVKLNTTKFDSVINVTVLDSVRANFSAVRTLDSSPLTNSAGALNVVEGGREITFMQNCTGEPTSLRWILSRKDGFVREVTGDTVTTKLNSVGNYDMMLIASSSFGADTLAFKDYIKIIPSTDPMNLESVTADKKIYLTYSRDVDSPVTCDPASISLTVTNNGNTVSGIQVTGFALNPQLPNIVELTLNQEIYNTDEILISYDDQVGNLISADGMKISSFTDQPVAFTSKKDLFAQIGFDGTVENSTNTNWTYAWWGGQWGMYNADNNVSTTRAHNGTHSLYFDMQAEGGAVLNFVTNSGTTLNTVPVKSGKLYEGSFWLYIEAQGNSTSNFLWMLPNNGWATMMGVNLSGSEATGQWIKETFRYEATATEDLQFIIRGYNPGASQLKIYVDDMKFEELEKRP